MYVCVCVGVSVRVFVCVYICKYIILIYEIWESPLMCLRDLVQ